MNQKGVITLVVPFLLFIIVAVVFLLIYQGIIKIPSKLAPAVKVQEPTVSLQTKYENPFGEKYTNPFSGNKNIFDGLK